MWGWRIKISTVWRAGRHLVQKTTHTCSGVFWQGGAQYVYILTKGDLEFFSTLMFIAFGPRFWTVWTLRSSGGFSQWRVTEKYLLIRRVCVFFDSGDVGVGQGADGVYNES